MLIEMGLDPLLIHLGGFQLAWKGMLTALAIIVAVWYGESRLLRAGLPEAAFGRVVLWAIIGGLIGARLFHVADNLDLYAASPIHVLFFWQGGLAVYGAFIGGVAAAIVVARGAGFSIWKLLDAGGPPMLVGQAVGRFGCLVNGDAWGAPTGGSWGIVYTHEGAVLPRTLLGVPTHPYPLYEMFAVAAWLGILFVMHDRLSSRGTTFLVAMVGYGVIRFFLTYFRQETILFWGLQEAQVIGLLTALAAAIGLLVLRFVHPKTSAALPEPEGTSA